MSGDKLSAGDFGVAFKGFLEQAVTQAPAPEPFFRAALGRHFATGPTARRRPRAVAAAPA